MIALALLAFALFGVMLVAPGVVQAPVARDLGLDLTRSSLVASALAAGLGVGVFVSGPLLDRVQRRPIFVLSALGGGAALLLAAGPLGFTMLIVAFVGAGVLTFRRYDLDRARHSQIRSALDARLPR
jgi:MFS family permease